MMCRFERGAMGHLYFSRIATGRKMGYAYEITGTKGAIRFDQEDQNALWLYTMEGRRPTRGFTQDPDRPGASRLPALLPGARPWHRLSGPDHHRGAGFPRRHRDRKTRLADLPRRAGGQRNRGRGAGLVTDKNLANHPNALRALGHDHPNRQCALLLGRGISKRSAQPGLAHGARPMRRGRLHRHRAGARGLHARGPRGPRRGA
jgi:hypothetical protein